MEHAVADPGFEEGGFQVCGQSPHGCHRQLPHKRPMLGGSGGMPPQKVFAKWMLWESEASFPAFWGHLRRLYSWGQNPSFSVVLYNCNSSTNAHMGESLPIELRTAKIILIILLHTHTLDWPSVAFWSGKVMGQAFSKLIINVCK